MPAWTSTRWSTTPSGSSSCRRRPGCRGPRGRSRPRGSAGRRWSGRPSRRWRAGPARAGCPGARSSPVTPGYPVAVRVLGAAGGGVLGLRVRDLDPWAARPFTEYAPLDISTYMFFRVRPERSDALLAVRLLQVGADALGDASRAVEHLVEVVGAEVGHPEAVVVLAGQRGRVGDPVVQRAVEQRARRLGDALGRGPRWSRSPGRRSPEKSSFALSSNSTSRVRSLAVLTVLAFLKRRSSWPIPRPDRLSLAGGQHPRGDGVALGVLPGPLSGLGCSCVPCPTARPGRRPPARPWAVRS